VIGIVLRSVGVRVSIRSFRFASSKATHFVSSKVEVVWAERVWTGRSSSVERVFLPSFPPTPFATSYHEWGRRLGSSKRCVIRDAWQRTTFIKR